MNESRHTRIERFRANNADIHGAAQVRALGSVTKAKPQKARSTHGASCGEMSTPPHRHCTTNHSTNGRLKEMKKKGATGNLNSLKCVPGAPEVLRDSPWFRRRCKGPDECRGALTCIGHAGTVVIVWEVTK